MNTSPKLGRAVPEVVNVAPELTFDMLAGRPTPTGLGKAHNRVNVLQPLSLDMLAERGTPVLRLTIAFRSDATAAQIGRDYHRLYVLLNEHDLAHGGAGLRPVENPSESPSSNGEVQLAFRPLDPTNAAKRLEIVVAAIQSVASQLQSIHACKARIAA